LNKENGFCVKKLLFEGKYQYKFIVDGEEKHDPEEATTTVDGKVVNQLEARMSFFYFVLVY